MTPLRLTAAALACALFATPAAAQQFDTFASVCLDTHARREAAIEVLRGQNWFDATDPAGPRSEPGQHDMLYYANFPGGQGPDHAPANAQMVMLSHAPSDEALGVAGSHVDSCSVMAINPAAGSSGKTVTARLGFEPFESADTLYWVFTIQDGAIKRVDGQNEPEFLNLLGTHEVHIVSLSSTGMEPLMMLDVSRPNR